MKLDLSKLQLDDHAKQRIEERFGHKTEQAALQFCKSLLGKARCMGETVCERGHKSMMYSVQGIAFYLSMDDPHLIKTVMKVRQRQYLLDVEHENPLHKQLVSLYEKELRKHSRFEQAQLKRIILTQLENDVKIAQLKCRIHKTRSTRVKEECKSIIAEIQSSTSDLQTSLETIRSNKRKIAKALTVLL